MGPRPFWSLRAFASERRPSGITSPLVPDSELESKAVPTVATREGGSRAGSTLVGVLAMGGGCSVGASVEAAEMGSRAHEASTTTVERLRSLIMGTPFRFDAGIVAGPGQCSPSRMAREVVRKFYRIRGHRLRNETTAARGQLTYRAPVS